MNQNEPIRTLFTRIQNVSLIIGIVGLIICAVGYFLTAGSNQFFQSYLIGMMFWIQVSVGCMLILMGHHLAGGKWGAVIQRIVESGTMVFPVLGVLFIPILVGIPQLYEWAMPDIVAHDEIIQFKQPYLNTPFFVARTIFYFGLWSVLAYLLNKSSLELDKTGDIHIKNRMKNISGPGVLIFGLAVTFASFDWMMSLEPHWFSTIYGFMYGTGSAISAFCFVILMVSLLLSYQPFSELIGVRQINDYSNFLFGAVMTWGYVQLCQGLIIWSGDVAEFTPWYITRTTHGWQYLYIFVVLFQFAVPFSILLIWPIKRNIKILAAIAAFVFLMRFADLLLLIAPAHVFHHAGLTIHWLDVVALIGIGGIWMATFSWVFSKKPSFIPLRDPQTNLQEQVHHGTHGEPSPSY